MRALTIATTLTLISALAWAQEDPDAAAPAEEAKPKMAVLDVQVKNIDAETGSIFSEVLTAEVDNLGEYDIMSGSEIAALLGFEQQKQMIGCDDTSCMAELGGALGAEFLVVSQVGLVGKTYVVSIKLINVKEAKTMNRVYETVEARVDSVLELIRISVPRLFGREAKAKPKPKQIAAAPTSKVEKSADASGGDGGGVPVLPIVLIAGGAVVAGVGGALDGVALGMHDTVKSKSSTLSEAQAAASDGQMMSTIAVIMYGVGAVTAVTGIILLAVSGGDEAEQTASVMPWVGPEAVGATLTVRGW